MLAGVTPQLESILAAGNHAPSGENSQPWRFVIKGANIVDLYLVPERDQSHYNWGQRASYVALGAVIENIVIAASAFGMKVDISLFPGGDPNLVATLNLISDPTVRHDPLEEHILLRVTNRKKYAPIRLTDVERRSLQEMVRPNQVAKLYLVDERSSIQRLAKVGAANEEIMLTNEALHQFFFSHISWTKEEDNAKKSGFYIKTLELPPLAESAFYIIQNWSVMQFLNNVHFERFVGNQNASIYAASGAMGGIAIEKDEPSDFLQAGRLFQNTWLAATKLGFSLQPLTGILFFKNKIDGGQGDVFSGDQRARIEEEYKTAKQIFGIESKRLVCMFRLGAGAPPTARSSRFDLSKVVSI